MTYLPEAVAVDTLRKSQRGWELTYLPEAARGYGC
jgi:hypothetical protein